MQKKRKTGGKIIFQEKPSLEKGHTCQKNQRRLGKRVSQVETWKKMKDLF